MIIYVILRIPEIHSSPEILIDKTHFTASGNIRSIIENFRMNNPDFDNKHHPSFDSLPLFKR